jgi:hypothetical protein
VWQVDLFLQSSIGHNGDRFDHTVYDGKEVSWRPEKNDRSNFPTMFQTVTLLFGDRPLGSRSWKIASINSQR